MTVRIEQQGEHTLPDGQYLRWVIDPTRIHFQRWESSPDVDGMPITHIMLETTAKNRIVLHELLTLAGCRDGKQLNRILGCM